MRLRHTMAIQIMVSRREPPTVFRVSNQLLMTYHYDSRFVHHFSLVRDASVFSRQQPTQRPTTGEGAETKRLENVLQEKEHIDRTHSSKGLKVIAGEGVERIEEPEAVDDHGKNTFWAQQGRWKYELKMGVTPCTRPAQAEARPNPVREREAGHDAPPLADQLLVIISCWRIGVSFLQECM